MGKFACIVAISLVVYVSKVHAWDYTDCGSNTAVGKLQNVLITPCGDDEDACVLQRGTTVKLAISFMSYIKAKKAKPVVHGYISGIPIPFSVPEKDGCTNSGLVCPLVKGQNYTYTSDLPILNSYPAIDVTVKWELQCETGDDLFCMKIPARIE